MENVKFPLIGNLRCYVYGSTNVAVGQFEHQEGNLSKDLNNLGPALNLSGL